MMRMSRSHYGKLWPLSEKIVDTVHEPMLVLDDKLRITAASRAFCQTFGVTAEDTVGRLLYEMGWR